MATTEPKAPPETPFSGTIIRCPDFSNEDALFEGESESAFLPMPIDLPYAQRPSDIAAQAANISTDFPSVWFVNFPPSLSGSQKQQLAAYKQEVLDYRSWSSLQWWESVFRRIPPGPDRETKMMQSRELATVAYIHMKKTPWLIKTKDNETSRRINCRISEFHARLIQEAMSQFVQLDRSALAGLEPVLISIVRSVNESTSFRDIKTIVTEKYEYLHGSNTIRSFVRLICFQVAEAFYDVQNGKSSSERYVICDMAFLEYEALFNSDEWNKRSVNIQDQQREAMKDFVNRQTVDVEP